MMPKEFYKISAENNHKILNRYLVQYEEANKNSFMYGLTKRSDLLRRFSFAVPTYEALEAINNEAPILEIGAGLGYWVYLLRSLFGTDVIATDKVPVQLGVNPYFSSNSSIDGVHTYTFEKRRAFINDIIFPTKAMMQWVASDRALFICWPDYDDKWAYEQTKMYLDFGGQTLIYIGEHDHGCNAEENFFDLLELCFVRDECDFAIPQWEGIHDYFNIYRRK